MSTVAKAKVYGMNSIKARQIAVPAPSHITILSKTFSTPISPSAPANVNSVAFSTNFTTTSNSTSNTTAVLSSTFTPAQVSPPIQNQSTGLAPPILAAVILAGFALVALTALGVWLHHRRAKQIASLAAPGARRRYNWYPEAPDAGHWDDGSGARTLRTMSLAAKRASSVFAGRISIAKAKHVRIETKEYAARGTDGIPVYEGI